MKMWPSLNGLVILPLLCAHSARAGMCTCVWGMRVHMCGSALIAISVYVITQNIEA